jgi:DNA-directed RNA polymerase subunit E'/Rpb7
MFDPCVNRTVELIDGQVAEIHKKGARVKVSHLPISNGRGGRY